MIKTESGNAYFLSPEGIINSKTRSFYKAEGLPSAAQDLSVRIGEPLGIPGVGSTSRVTEVELRYKIYPSDSTPQGIDRTQQTDPFLEMDGYHRALRKSGIIK